MNRLACGIAWGALGATKARASNAASVHMLLCRDHICAWKPRFQEHLSNSEHSAVLHRARKESTFSNSMMKHIISKLWAPCADTHGAKV